VDGNIWYLYAALGVTLLTIVGYLLSLNGRLQALRREHEALDRGGAWPTDGQGDV